MAKYFETFPKLLYDIDNTKNFKLVTDIFRRIKVREQLKEKRIELAKNNGLEFDTRTPEEAFIDFRISLLIYLHGVFFQFIFFRNICIDNIYIYNLTVICIPI